MNVKRWTPSWWRRLQFVWIVPYVVLAYVPFVVVIGMREVGNPMSGFGDVWRGKRRQYV